MLPEAPTSQSNSAEGPHPKPAPIHFEPRFTPATDSQLLVIETGLRLLSLWAVRAAESARQAAPPT